jgi:hypothetical protein
MLPSRVNGNKGEAGESFASPLRGLNEGLRKNRDNYRILRQFKRTGFSTVETLPYLK